MEKKTKIYEFTTQPTMKEYNREKYYMGDCVPVIRVKAESVQSALKEYQHIVNNDGFVQISDNGLKQKRNMYIDMENTETSIPVQVGYVLTAKTYIESTVQFIDLWITIETISNPFCTE